MGGRLGLVFKGGSIMSSALLGGLSGLGVLLSLRWTKGARDLTKNILVFRTFGGRGNYV